MPKKDLLTFDGVDPSALDSCEAKSYYGFPGLDAEVVSAIALWIKRALGPELGRYRWFRVRIEEASEMEGKKVIGAKNLVQPSEPMRKIHPQRNPIHKRKGDEDEE